MAASRVLEIIRHFRENGLKLLLENPANARELLALTATHLLDRMDFAHMAVDPTTYIAADYRHLASDLVLLVPFRTPSGRRTITLYILLEHQSEPDSLMRMRVLDYVLQIYKRQAREWQARHGSLAGFQFDPVLPVVLDTGATSWPELPRLVDQVRQGEDFVAVIPDIDPLYVNLPELTPATLEGVGPLGWVLELMQQRRAGPEAFRALVVRVVRHLEEMPAKQRQRWLELLSYIRALVYHDRERSEQEGLREVIVASIRSDERRRDVENLTMTGAEALREQGRKEGRQQGEIRALQRTLANLLRKKFGRLPRSVERVIRGTESPGRLESWVVQAGTASSLDEIGIEPGTPSTP
jgi:predicted transposase YdaD